MVPSSDYQLVESLRRAPLDPSEPVVLEERRALLDALMQHEYPGRKIFFVAENWGGGIASSYAAAHNDRIEGFILLDPIVFDGYPVNEIQAIGCGSLIPNRTSLPPNGPSRGLS